VVEPHHGRRKTISDLFSHDMPGNYELHLANSYADTVSMAKRGDYDVCLAPSRMDDRDAMELLSELAGQGWKIPVIILTGNRKSAPDGADPAASECAGPLAYDQFSGNFLEQHIKFAIERNKLETAVIRAEEEWENLFDALPDLISVIDRNYRVLRVNKAMADRLGAKPQDLIGRNCYEIVHGLCSPPEFCPMSLMLKDGKEHFAEIFEKNLNCFFRVSASPCLDDDNNIIGGIHVARDISHIKAIEEQLRDSNQRLEQRVAERTSELVEKAKDLKEANIALNVILKNREQDRTAIEESITQKFREQISLQLRQIDSGLFPKELLNSCVRAIDNVFDNRISTFMQVLHNKRLSPAEIKVAEMIRSGKNNKEIAALMFISTGTVRTHRERIRKKLGLTNQKTNLTIYLQLI